MMKCMMKRVVVILLLFIVGLTDGLHAQPHAVIQKRLGIDSTFFLLQVKKGRRGHSSLARIHVTPGSGWHVYSSRMSKGDGPVPLSVALVPELANRFRLSHLKEIGRPT